jgi:hypothetical protein
MLLFLACVLTGPGHFPFPHPPYESNWANMRDVSGGHNDVSDDRGDLFDGMIFARASWPYSQQHLHGPYPRPAMSSTLHPMHHPSTQYPPALDGYLASAYPHPHVAWPCGPQMQPFWPPAPWPRPPPSHHVHASSPHVYRGYDHGLHYSPFPHPSSAMPSIPPYRPALPAPPPPPMWATMPKQV